MKSGPRLVRPPIAANTGGSLGRIAAALGVPVERLYEAAGPLVLHVASDGMRWLLLCDEAGHPIVRRISGPDAGSYAHDDSVSAFLTRDADSPQHKALVALIDRLLATHQVS